VGSRIVRRTTLRAEVLKADPEYPVTSRLHVEYDFSRPGGPYRRDGSPKGEFKAWTDRRGAYNEPFEE
jgi:hypothetical protein